MTRDLHRHIELIYDFVTDPNGAANLVGKLVNDLEFRSGTFYIEKLDRPAVKYFCRPGFSDEESQLYQDRFYQLDAWIRGLSQLPKGHFYESDIVASLNSLKRTEFYNDWLKKIDLAKAMGGYMSLENKHVSRISFHHTHAQGEFGDKTEYLNQLAPHLKRAISLQQKIADSQCHASSITSIADKLKVASLIVDGSGKIRYKNAEMDSLAKSSSVIRIVNKHLRLPDYAQGRIDRVIHCAVMNAQGSERFESDNRILIHDSEGAPTHEIEIESVSGYDHILGLQYQVAMALVLITEVAQAATLNEPFISDTYGLTLKELQLAKHLIEGLSLNEIATKSNRSINTVKTQLRSLFAKTGTNSQSKLISCLLQGHRPLSQNSQL